MSFREQDTRGLILESLRRSKENTVEIDEATSLSHDQIKWLFANGAATDVGGKVVIDWEKAKKAGWNPTNGKEK